MADCPSLSVMRGWAAARVVLVVLAAVAVLAVVAVGTYWLVRAWQSEEPVPLPTPTVTSSPVPTSGTAAPSTGPATTAPTPPPFPPEASAETAEGAVAFVEWWFAELSYAYATGDTARLRAYSSEECATCSNLIQEIDDIYTSGAEVQGREVSLTSLSARNRSEVGYIVDYFVDSTPAFSVASDGSTISSLPPDVELPARSIVQSIDSTTLMLDIGQPVEESN